MSSIGKLQEFVFYDVYDTFISFHGRAWFNLGATLFCERQSPIFSNILECGLNTCSSLGYQWWLLRVWEQFLHSQQCTRRMACKMQAFMCWIGQNVRLVLSKNKRHVVRFQPVRFSCSEQHVHWTNLLANPVQALCLVFLFISESVEALMLQKGWTPPIDFPLQK